MVKWLKFFFGSFFDDRQAKLAPTRRYLNCLLAFLLGFALMYFGLTIGYLQTFGHHYSNSSAIKNVVANLFDTDVDGAPISIKIDGIKASADAVVNTYDDPAAAEKFVVGGYNVILDTRPLKTTYDDFNAYCAKGDERISYEKYRTELTESERSEYKFTVEYSGKKLEFTPEKLDGYAAYLDLTGDETSAEYNADVFKAYGELKDRRDELGAGEYENALYELYVKAYYPDISKTERYGNAPTLRTYYVSNILATDKAGHYFAVFDDSIYGRFVTDGGIDVPFNGCYRGLDGFTVSSGNADEFVTRAFSAMSGSWMSIYFLNMMQVFPFTLIAWLVCALIVFIVCKLSKDDYGSSIGDALRIVGSFLLISFVLTFLGAIILGFTVSRDLAYGFTIYIFCGVLLLRTIILVTVEGIKHAIAKRKAAEAGTDEIDETDDVFPQYPDSEEE